MPMIRNENLVRTVIGKSGMNLWEDARAAFDIKYIHWPSEGETCICGAEPTSKILSTETNKSFFFTLEKMDRDPDSRIYPICENCVCEHFTNMTTKQNAILCKQLYMFGKALEDHPNMEFGSRQFTPDIMRYLRSNVKIEPNQYNKMNPSNDWKFVEEMNSAMRTPSTAQKKKAGVILSLYIRPHMKKVMREISVQECPADVIKYRVKYNQIWVMSPILTKDPYAKNANFFTTDCPLDKGGLCSTCPEFHGVYPDNKRTWNNQTEYEGFCG